jgi:hypothetical protein
LSTTALAPVPLADQRGDFADLRTDVVQVLGNADFQYRNADTLEHRDRGSRGVDAGDDQIRVQRDDLFGQPVIDHGAGAELGHVRILGVTGEPGHRRDVLRFREPQHELVHAHVEGDDTPGLSRRIGRTQVRERREQRHRSQDRMATAHHTNVLHPRLRSAIVMCRYRLATRIPP